MDEDALARKKFRKKLLSAEYIPRGNEFSLNPVDFDYLKFSKETWAIYSPFDKPKGFQNFMRGLETEVIETGWTPQMIILQPDRDLKRANLNIFYTNKEDGPLETFGDYGSEKLIRKNILKPFDNGWAINFGQNELARHLDKFFIGTGLIATYVHDSPHQIILKIKKPSWKFWDKYEDIVAYPTGVRRLSIELESVGTAIDIVNEWMQRHKENSYILYEGKKRLIELEKWKGEIQNHF